MWLSAADSPGAPRAKDAFPKWTVRTAGIKIGEEDELNDFE